MFHGEKLSPMSFHGWSGQRSITARTLRMKPRAALICAMLAYIEDTASGEWNASNSQANVRRRRVSRSCTFFITTIEFRPTLQKQRDDAENKGQIARQKIYDGLLERLDNEAS